MGACFEHRRRGPARVPSPRTGATVAAVVSLAPGNALLLPTDGRSIDEQLSAVVGDELRPARFDHDSAHRAADPCGDGSVGPHLHREPGEDPAASGEGARAPPGEEKDK